MEVSLPDASRYGKVLVYGPAGNGKTTFISSAQDDERTSPMLVLDYDGGSEVLAGTNIDVGRVRDWDDYTEAYNMLERTKKYKSVGIDSLSETHTMALFARLDDPSKVRKIEFLLEQGDYGIALTQMRRLIRSFRDLPMHVFFTALMKEEADVREGVVKKPAVPGSFAEDVLGIPNIVGYLALKYDDDGNLSRTLLLRYPKIRTKVRVPMGTIVPDEIEEPTVKKLLDLVLPASLKKGS